MALLELMMMMDIPEWGWWHSGCLWMLLGSYVINLVKHCWVRRHKETFQRLMTLLELLLELMMIMDIADLGWCPWRYFGLSRYTLRKLGLKFCWNLVDLKTSRILSKIDDIARVVMEFILIWYWHSWPDLVSLMMLLFVWVCSDGALFNYFFEICWIWRHQEPFYRLMIFLELLMELTMIKMYLQLNP